MRTRFFFLVCIGLATTSLAQAQCPSGRSAASFRIGGSVVSTRSAPSQPAPPSPAIGMQTFGFPMSMPQTSHWLFAPQTVSPYLTGVPTSWGPKLLPGEPIEYRQPQSRQDQQLIREFDVNSDGQLSNRELPERLQRKLGIVDVDGNGVFSPGEIPETSESARRSQLDARKNPELRKGEFQKRNQRPRKDMVSTKTARPLPHRQSHAPRRGNGLDLVPRIDDPLLQPIK